MFYDWETLYTVGKNIRLPLGFRPLPEALFYHRAPVSVLRAAEHPLVTRNIIIIIIVILWSCRTEASCLYFVENGSPTSVRQPDCMYDVRESRLYYYHNSKPGCQT